MKIGLHRPWTCKVREQSKALEMVLMARKEEGTVMVGSVGEPEVCSLCFARPTEPNDEGRESEMSV